MWISLELVPFLFWHTAGVPPVAPLAAGPLLPAGACVAVPLVHAEKTSSAPAPNAPSLLYFIKCSSSGPHPPLSADVSGRYPCRSNPRLVASRLPSPIVPWPKGPDAGVGASWTVAQR